jgi:hypothetical protein
LNSFPLTIESNSFIFFDINIFYKNYYELFYSLYIIVVFVILLINFRVEFSYIYKLNFYVFLILSSFFFVFYTSFL